ncbi:putative OCRE domain-containing protein [Helianthus annuus]|nr:putative OCRE domain-containing protein [Helianthus annuus]
MQEDFYQWDFHLQLYYHARSGYYHDPVAGWSYSAHEGRYYRFENGSYVPWESPPTWFLEPVASTPALILSSHPPPTSHASDVEPLPNQPIRLLGPQPLELCFASHKHPNVVPTMPTELPPHHHTKLPLQVPTPTYFVPNIPKSLPISNFPTFSTNMTTMHETIINLTAKFTTTQYVTTKLEKWIEAHFSSQERPQTHTLRVAIWKREWRPPWQPKWCPIETELKATGRREWRPPWTEHSVLEDKDVFNGWALIRACHIPMTSCNPSNTYIHAIHRGLFTLFSY